VLDRKWLLHAWARPSPEITNHYIIMATPLFRHIRSFVLGFLLCAALAATASAQGLIAGRVVDTAGGGALPGAQVTIRETGQRVATNAQGEYLLSSVAAGAYTVDVSYLGHTEANASVTVTDGQRATLDFKLSSTEVVELDRVVITSIREGTARALNQQRTAVNLANVISSDAIGRFPDPNVAEALQRVPGIGVERDQGEGRFINIRGAPIEFTAVTIDGVSLPSPEPGTRAINLDVLPSDVVSSVEVTKALRPDQDADSISGAVNIRTESPFDHDGLRVRGMAGASYNEFGGTSDSRGSLTASNRFGTGREFGLLVSASYSKTRRQVDNVENVWIYVNRPDGGEVATIDETLFKDYDTRRERQAVTATLEWRPTAESKLYLRYAYSEYTDDEFRNRLGFQWSDGTLQPGATNTSATYAGMRISKQFRHRILRNEINAWVAGGEAQLGALMLDGAVSYAESVQDYPSRNELLYRTGGNITSSYDTGANPDQPVYSIFTTGQHLELSRYGFRENTFRTNDTAEDERGFQGNGTLPIALGGPSTAAKFGFKFRDKDKVAEEERFRNRAAGAAPSQGIAALLSNVASSNYDYVLGQKFDSTLVNAYLDGARAASPRRNDVSDTADYTAREKVWAGYAQLNYDLGDLNILGGVRLEHTDFTGSAPRYNTNTGVVTPQTASRSYSEWFPALHARYSRDGRLVYRAAITRGIARPNFLDIVPRLVDTTDGAGTSVNLSQGNPALKPALSTNLDAMVEYYFEPIGLFSAGVFQKDVDDFVFTSRTTGTFNGLPARISRPENAQGGEIRGFELAYQQKFVQLPGALGGLGVYGNYTYTDSSVRAPFIDNATGLSTRSRSVQLPGQSETTYNLAVFYERHGLNARLAYTSRSDFLDEIDVERGADSDLWWKGRGQLDLTASYQVTKSVNLFVEWKNISSTAGVRYTGNSRQVEEYEEFGYTLFGGVKVNF
jgi:TonB-dependent receptor